jgi:hypothetical protein
MPQSEKIFAHRFLKTKTGKSSPEILPSPENQGTETKQETALSTPKNVPRENIAP